MPRHAISGDKAQPKGTPKTTSECLGRTGRRVWWPPKTVSANRVASRAPSAREIGLQAPLVTTRLGERSRAGSLGRGDGPAIAGQMAAGAPAHRGDARPLRAGVAETMKERLPGSVGISPNGALAGAPGPGNLLGITRRLATSTTAVHDQPSQLTGPALAPASRQRATDIARREIETPTARRCSWRKQRARVCGRQ
jgi:hypothetical protein